MAQSIFVLHDVSNRVTKRTKKKKKKLSTIRAHIEPNAYKTTAATRNGCLETPLLFDSRQKKISAYYYCYVFKWEGRGGAHKRLTCFYVAHDASGGHGRGVRESDVIHGHIRYVAVSTNRLRNIVRDAAN